MLVQLDGGVGLTVPDLITRLVSMGVEDAVLGDGSNSATLVVDGTVEVQPSRIKNNSIPVGPMFRLHEFRLKGRRSMNNATAAAGHMTTDPRFQSALAVSDTEGTIRATNTGLDLEITSLGTPSDMSSNLSGLLGVSLPLRCMGTSSRITSGVSLVAPRLTGQLTLVPTQTSDGHVTGHLLFMTSKGTVRFDFDWEVEHHP